MALDVNKTPFLFSMGTFLAYRIDEQYYRNVHYVWCTNKFHSDLQPGTSDPQTIGNTFLHDIKTGEQYSKAIMYNKAGILISRFLSVIFIRIMPFLSGGLLYLITINNERKPLNLKTK